MKISKIFASNLLFCTIFTVFFSIKEIITSVLDKDNLNINDYASQSNIIFAIIILSNINSICLQVKKKHLNEGKKLLLTNVLLVFP